MKYLSTRGKSPKVSFKEAVFQGLAPDGGLYIPETIPSLSQQQIQKLRNATIDEIGAIILSLFISDIPSSRLQQIIAKGLTFPLPLQSIADKTVLELFHGPTMAFKDIAAQILPLMMEYYLEKENRSLTILTATSGDTGGAVAHGFAHKKNMKVIILFPKGKVSNLQHEQLTHVANNIFPVEIEGTFDDCQDLVKKAFSDDTLNTLNLTSANSINIGRLLPQMLYYAYVWSKLQRRDLQCIIPSGNMGNITAGLYAQKIGIPINSFIIACNSNDPVVKYYQSAVFKPQETIQTLSTAMDIGNPSNFERIMSLTKNHKTFIKYIEAAQISDEETVKTIKNVYTKYQYLLDPHTAVAWSAAEKFTHEKCHQVVVATASPDKFVKEIRVATGIKHTPPVRMYAEGKRLFRSSARYEDVKKVIFHVLE